MFLMSFSEELTNNRRANKCSDTLEQEKETKGICELVCTQEVGQNQSGQQNIGGTDSDKQGQLNINIMTFEINTL